MDKFITVINTAQRTVKTANSQNMKPIKPSAQLSSSHKAPVYVARTQPKTLAPPATVVGPHTNTNVISVFTDGSCIQNGKGKKHTRPAGYACVFPEHPSFNYGAKLLGPEKTNNRAEYTACIVAFQIAEKIDPKMQKLLYVYTDSELLINSLTKWLPGWKSKNWRKADGSPVKNVDLLKALDEQMQKRVVVFRHVRAHTGKQDWQSIHNDIADKMAKQAALS